MFHICCETDILADVVRFARCNLNPLIITKICVVISKRYVLLNILCGIPTAL